MPLSSFLSSNHFTPMKTLRKISLAAIAFGLCLSVSSSFGATIVHWGDSTGYVTATAEFAFSGSGTSGNYWRSGAPQNVTPLTGYSTPSGRTSDIFAVFQQETVTTDKTFVALNIADGGASPDFIRMTGRDNSTLSGLIYFTKTGFLNGFHSGTLSLSGVEDIKFTLAGNNAAQTTVLRAAVLNGTEWFLSSVNSTSNAAGTVTFSDINSSTWSAWDPSQFPLYAAPGLYGTSSSSLTDVQAFGLYFTTTRDSQTRLNLSGYEVIAIPEPSAWILAAMGLTMLLVFRRRNCS